MIVTAAHCVYNRSTGWAAQSSSNVGWKTNIQYWPALDGGSAPFGSFRGRRKIVPGQWTRGDGTSDWDIAIIKVDDKDGRELGQHTGSFGWHSSNKTSGQVEHIHTFGYPSSYHDATRSYYFYSRSGMRKTSKGTAALHYPFGRDLLRASGGPWVKDLFGGNHNTAAKVVAVFSGREGDTLYGAAFNSHNFKPLYEKALE